jgi:hypothetical protein
VKLYIQSLVINSQDCSQPPYRMPEESQLQKNFVKILQKIKPRPKTINGFSFSFQHAFYTVPPNKFRIFRSNKNSVFLT